MKRYIIAAAVLAAFATPALAGGVGANFYVVLMLGGTGCQVSTAEPDAQKHKMMGKYKSEADAKAAMATMKECGG
jgi:hypothetical protein